MNSLLEMEGVENRQGRGCYIVFGAFLRRKPLVCKRRIKRDTMCGIGGRGDQTYMFKGHFVLKKSCFKGDIFITLCRGMSGKSNLITP